MNILHKLCYSAAFVFKQCIQKSHKIILFLNYVIFNNKKIGRFYHFYLYYIIDFVSFSDNSVALKIMDFLFKIPNTCVLFAFFCLKNFVNRSMFP